MGLLKAEGAVAAPEDVHSASAICPSEGLNDWSFHSQNLHLTKDGPRTGDGVLEMERVRKLQPPLNDDSLTPGRDAPIPSGWSILAEPAPVLQGIHERLSIVILIHFGINCGHEVIAESSRRGIVH